MLWLCRFYVMLARWTVFKVVGQICSGHWETLTRLVIKQSIGTEWKWRLILVPADSRSTVLSSRLRFEDLDVVVNRHSSPNTVGVIYQEYFLLITVLLLSILLDCRISPFTGYWIWWIWIILCMRNFRDFGYYFYVCESLCLFIVLSVILYSCLCLFDVNLQN